MKLKIPPPLWTLLTALTMWLLAHIAPDAFSLPSASWLAAIIAVAGGLITAAGARALSQAKTTLSPHHPDQTTQIVRHGILRFSRNPMYLGMALFLTAWAIFLGHMLAWLGVVGFIWIITVLQIQPEERLLAEKFGADYADYCRQTRRWL
ncbi:isoprenylcysteine carboxylmethyltransferase family protein [Neisseria sp. ZJ106]|uniref:Isoprenylcysteine carboxylmethyltransferase family protein n=1 Tax=Neisseria lisongii TaxID=2912188 RepID=A0ABY7RII2_9NEIS|nr:isoprenylcysteine carboxylmethyltransferase family protein [Neisseria lisongii]MCF7520619.1 isoprenylcysteine carboxylmethyltransferase family protein [Neisseria lisongii]WCL71447.1 isoprenylcysteine carboxylmethyltransferase family protein [Neisseria lisongii]